MGSTLQDLQVAVRSLYRMPSYGAAFVLTLGLGIGANSAIFSVVNGVLLRPLPHRDGDRLVYLRHSARLAGVDNVLFSVPEIADYRALTDSLEGVAEFSAMTFTMLSDDEPSRVRAGVVSANYFEVMGLAPSLGRLIGPADDGEAADPVATLTHDYWQRVFGADPGVVGRIVRMNGRTVEIIGVVEPAPPYPERTDLYVNMVTSPHHLSATMNHDRLHRMTEVFARLAPAATLRGARLELSEITARLHGEHPQAYDSTQGYVVSLTPLAEQLARRARPTMLMLSGVAAFVLVIACANVVNLTLARVARRRHELEVRAALGASRLALRRLLLIETLVPSLAGAGIGLFIAYQGVDLLAEFAARYTARATEITVDGTVLTVTLMAGLAAACLFAWAPRLPSPGAGAHGLARATASAGGRRTQRALVVLQISVCFVLLVGAGLLVRSLLTLQASDGGLAVNRVLTLDIPPSPARTEAESRAFYESVLERVRALPGVRDAALGTTVPLRGAPTGLSAFVAAVEFEIEGQPPEPAAARPRADFRPVSRDYFRTLGMSLLGGRGFEATDTRDSAPVVVINEAMARHYFPAQEAVGKRLAWRDDVLRFIGGDESWRTIVGVVSDTLDYGVDRQAPHVVFQPFAQLPAASSLFVRTPTPAALTRPIVDAIRSLDPEQPVENVETLAQVRNDAIAPQRLNAILVGCLALLALTVAVVGVGGMLSFSVSQRTRELGIRAAFGADRGALVRSVLAEGTSLTLIGIGFGLTGSVGVSRLVRSLLYGVAPGDLATFLGVAIVLAGVALAASWFPARRASRIDPVEILRTD